MKKFDEDAAKFPLSMNCEKNNFDQRRHPKLCADVVNDSSMLVPPKIVETL